MINLSSLQASVVHAPIGGAMQVLASAGTGKTRVLTERVRFVLGNTKRDGVIALTFTNKAAEEMVSRLEDIAGFEDRCWVSTIHSVAQRILEQYGNTIGLPSELHIYERDQDRKTVFLQSLRESGVDIDAFLNVSDENTRRDRERTISNYMAQFSLVKRELLTEEEIRRRYESSNERFFDIYKAYQEALLESGGIDFDDILAYAHRILMEQPWCGQVYRAKYKHICVDEAQDLNKAQYEFVKALCSDQIRSVLMVGDPNQMIYGFNGSSHDFLCVHFVNDFDPSKYELKENYRSSRFVVRLANKLKPNSQVVSDYALEGKGEIVVLPDEQGEAVWIVDKINEILSNKIDVEIEGEIGPDKMVVIASNRYVFQTLESVLQERKIPFSLKRDERMAEPSSVFGKALDLGIRLRLNPKDWVDGKKLCAALKISAPQSWSDDDVLSKFANAVAEVDTPFQAILSRMLGAIQKLDAEQPNIPKLCNEMSASLRESAVKVSDENISGEFERALGELEDFRRYWTNFKRKGLGESLSAFRNAMALGQLAEEFKASGLTLSTVHTMKGLEKDIVFLMGMCEGTFPDYRSRSEREVSEERNKAFVAVTRSRRWIFITCPQVKMMPWGSTKVQSPSRFIREMQQQEYH
jgi:DNA helicase-2/ATP-dependent DNA helicase PcrA